MSPDLSVSQDRRALTTVSGKQLRAFVALVLCSRSQLGAVLGRSDLILSSCNYTIQQVHAQIVKQACGLQPIGRTVWSRIGSQLGMSCGSKALRSRISKEPTPVERLVSLELSNSDSQARPKDSWSFSRQHEVQRTSSLPDGKFWYVGCPAASCAGC